MGLMRVWSSLHLGATCPGHRAMGWANHVRGVIARMETVPAGWCGETSIAWPAWPRRGKVADSLEPVWALGAPGSLNRETGNPYCGGDTETWGTFREPSSSPSTNTRLDLTASGWIPLTYSLPDPGWPQLVGRNDAGVATELGGIPILPTPAHACPRLPSTLP